MNEKKHIYGENIGLHYTLTYDYYIPDLQLPKKTSHWDGRISRVNREWAQSVPVVPNPDSWGGDRNCYFVVDQVHTGLGL